MGLDSALCLAKCIGLKVTSFGWYDFQWCTDLDGLGIKGYLFQRQILSFPKDFR